MVSKLARGKKPTGDGAYNARRRYFRAAERHMKKANQLSGASAARERKLAKIQFDRAMDTYDPSTTQKLSKPMQKLADELGVDVQRKRGNLQNLPESRIKELREKRKNAIGEESEKALEGNLQDVEKRREYEAQALFFESNISHRILGGLVNIWRKDENRGKDGKIRREKILPTLYEYFGVDNLADLMKKILKEMGEEFEQTLYDASQDEIYDVVKLQLQRKYA